MKKLIPLLLLFVLMACKGNHPSVPSSEATRPDSSMVVRYATGFKVDYFPTYKRIILADPWKKGSELVRYYLVRTERDRVPSDGIRIQIPLKSLVSGSCTQYAFLEELGVLSSVTGICDAKTIFNATLRASVQAGTVTDLGDPFQLDVERCLLLKPQIMLMNSFNQADEHLSRIRQSGIPVVYDNEWMEADLLARAEWIRFLACFFDKEAQADQLFQALAQRYEGLCRLAASVKTARPTVLSGDDFRGSWYLPGGRSYTAKLFSDAAGHYRYAADTTSGSRPFTFEQVVKDFHQADIWVGVTNGKSLRELEALDERYALFQAFRTGQVYAYTNRVTPQGGNDFWEGAVAKPDELLADFIRVFHPELLPSAPLRYLKKLR